jgi:hypothetical protein
MNKNKEKAMSIEKKSLISNRSVTKKALVTKPAATKVAPARQKVVATHASPARLNVARIKTGSF